MFVSVLGYSAVIFSCGASDESKMSMPLHSEDCIAKVKDLLKVCRLGFRNGRNLSFYEYLSF
jgi:hypothetical protein